MLILTNIPTLLLLVNVFEAGGLSGHVTVTVMQR